MTYKRIEDFASVITGGTPSTSNNLYWGGDIPWLNSGELNQKIIISSRNFITPEGLKNSAARMMPIDTVLIALTGATTGKTALLKIEACANQSVTGILPSPNHIPKYLYYYLGSIREKVIDQSYGGAQKHISQGFVKKLQIPLPSIDIQKRIVNILDESDSLRIKRKQAYNLLDNYLNSKFIEMFGDPAKNPKGWDIESLGTHANIKIGPFGSLLHKSDYIKNGIPLVNPKHMKNYKIVADTNTTITESKHEDLKSYHLRENDVVLARRGEIGRCCYVTKEHDGYLCGTGSMFIRPKNSLNTIYLVYMISTPHITSKLENRAKGITMKNLNAGSVQNLDIPLPPIELQNQFADIVKTTEILKKNMVVQSLEMEDQFKALLQKSFKAV